MVYLIKYKYIFDIQEINNLFLDTNFYYYQ